MSESIFFLASIFFFAMLGLLTAFIHGHGEIVATICGGLAGVVLAIIVPAVVSTSFMTNRKPLQYFIALVALISLLLTVGWEYNIIG